MTAAVLETTTLTVDPTVSPSPLAAVVAACLLNETAGSAAVKINWQVGAANGASMMSESGERKGAIDVAKALAEVYAAAFYPEGAALAEVEEWVVFSQRDLIATGYPLLIGAFARLDRHLKWRTFLTAHEPSIADILVWTRLKATPIWNKCFAANKDIGEDVSRWFTHMCTTTFVIEAQRILSEANLRLKQKAKDQGSFEIGLEDAQMGKVVTRFPPEPNGYLHIGHAKAAMLNQYFAQKYEGRMLIRFDDTNPSKEKLEFEESIKEDLRLLGIESKTVSYTSDYFDILYDYAIRLIKAGLAYCDDTPQEKMREERGAGIPSYRRDVSVEENLALFEEMRVGSERGLTFCLRAKISIDDPNKAMRDPVTYRCNLAPHHRTGTEYKMYPTYDFVCPVVDSIEGVTHALRSNEYRDRNAQYYWFIKALGLRRPFVWDFSRLNFVYTLLSKRKLTWFVESSRVAGWDDPRFPTVRGIRRRGLSVEALREYILMQGASQNTIMLEWDKLWTINKRFIDPIAPRFVALSKDNLCKINLIDGPGEPYVKEMPKHKKNPELGTKQTAFSSMVFIEQSDAADLTPGEEVTFMDWGNVIIESVQKDDGIAISIDARLHLSGDFKKTKKKLTWLSSDPHPLIDVCLYDYDYLITKRKLEEEDSIEDYLTPVSEFTTAAVGDWNLHDLKKGQYVQLERRGFFICDCEHSAGGPLKLIAVPDGKSKSIASKCDPTLANSAAAKS